MDIHVGEMQSSIQTTDSQRLLDPRLMGEIVRQCVAAVKEEQAREKRRASERALTNSIAPEGH